jgi:large subunit ribosomal protein L19
MNIEDLTRDQLKTDLPELSSGDTVRVHTRIKEGEKERVQIFEGIILKKSKGKGIKGSFTVRKIASGIGVERTFFLHSPNVLKIEIVRKGRVRRARLYYLRDIKSKTIKIKQQRYVTTKKKAQPAAEQPKDQPPASEIDAEETN